MRRMVALLLAVCMLFGLNEGSVSIAKNSSDNGIVPIFAGEETEEESSAFEEEYCDSESLSAIEETGMDDNMEEVGESTLMKVFGKRKKLKASSLIVMNLSRRIRWNWLMMK